MDPLEIVEKNEYPDSNTAKNQDESSKLLASNNDYEMYCGQLLRFNDFDELS